MFPVPTTHVTGKLHRKTGKGRPAVEMQGCKEQVKLNAKRSANEIFNKPSSLGCGNVQLVEVDFQCGRSP